MDGINSPGDVRLPIYRFSKERKAIVVTRGGPALATVRIWTAEDDQLDHHLPKAVVNNVWQDQLKESSE